MSSAENKDFKIRGDAKMWAVYGNTFSPCEKSVKKLPPGQYTIDISQERGIYFTLRDVNLDDLMVLPDSASEEIIREIEIFWGREEKYREYGFLWKRGVLLWGPPGSGKTTTLQQMSKMIIDRGGISVYVNNPTVGAKGLELMRRIEPKRPIVVMLEDIDATIKEYGESALLALLDGELQIDNVVFVATTNYPELLDKRIVNRPSRFDIVKKIPMPGTDARRMFLENKNPRLKDAIITIIDEKTKTEVEVNELDYWVERTAEFSIAHLKEMIISVECFGRPVTEVLKRLETMIKKKPSSGDTASGGFLK